MANLATVRPRPQPGRLGHEWAGNRGQAMAARGQRAFDKDIALHAGAAKYVCENFGFGNGSIAWMPSLRDADARVGTLDECRGWLREGHARLRASIAVLSDAELDAERPVHYSGHETARFIVATMIQHDLYHSGLINHLRPLRQGTDYWPGQSPAERERRS
jgi:hypothetical protein